MPNPSHDTGKVERGVHDKKLMKTCFVCCLWSSKKLHSDSIEENYGKNSYVNQFFDN